MRSSIGDAPVLLAAPGSRERLVDDREPFVSSTVTTESIHNLGKKWSVKCNFVVDGVFSHVTRPLTVWIAEKKIFERVISLRPYPPLALFAVPVIIVEPAKPLAG
jgi:hypothetical protein